MNGIQREKTPRSREQGSERERKMKMSEMKGFQNINAMTEAETKFINFKEKGFCSFKFN